MRPILILALLLGGCAPTAEAPSAPEGDDFVSLSVSIVDPLVIHGGALEIVIEGAELIVSEQVRVDFVGSVEGRDTSRSFSVTPEASEGGALRVRVSSEDLLTLSPGASQIVFLGAVRCTLRDISGQARAVGLSLDERIEVARTLAPTLDAPAQLTTHLGQIHEWSAGGLLKEDEGRSYLEISGAVEGRAPIAVGSGGRQDARVMWGPGLAGIEPRQIEGRVRIVNEHKSGIQLAGQWRSIEVEIERTEIWGFEPAQVSRGQKLNAVGQGFVAPDGASGLAMVFSLEGELQLRDGTRERVSWLWSPEGVDHHGEARLAMRTETAIQGDKEVLSGMSSRPGTFVGTVTPVLLSGGVEVRGEPWEGRLTIAPTRQIVFVRFLPDYVQTLEGFGLRNMAPEIRARVFEVLAAYFDGLNVTFVDEVPEGWLEYTTIEVGGADPNNAGLLGLDNTGGKDVGNLRLNDVIGGLNAQTRSEGYYAFGGVFVWSFVAFSPTLAMGSGLESPLFDWIFGPFMPELGGVPVEPGDGRGEEAKEAVRAMGSLIGHTISHELGHALGLAFRADGTFSADLDHNTEDEPGSLMDSGEHRPFEERCALAGAQEVRFNALHRRYLETILPRP